MRRSTVPDGKIACAGNGGPSDPLLMVENGMERVSRIDPHLAGSIRPDALVQVFPGMIL